MRAKLLSGSAATLARLTHMPMDEVACRGRQETRKWFDRVTATLRPLQLGTVASHGTARSDKAVERAVREFRRRAPERFFGGVSSLASRTILSTRLPEEVGRTVACGDAARRRQIDLLGYRGLRFGPSIDWHRDPVSGRRAPLRHWTRINPLDPAEVGDSKVTWELNRHQWVVAIAQAYWLTGDEAYAREAAAILLDWIRANPYGRGINWASSLEVAFRLIAWCWTLMLLGDSVSVTSREIWSLVTMIRRHALHIERYLSYYFSPNTHLTGEALGLWYAGVLFPEIAHAARWREVARRILLEQCTRQVSADGVHVERATCYQRYTIEIYQHFLMLADRSGADVPDVVRQRIERMVEVLLFMSRPDGSMPAIGDADGGWTLPFVERRPADCRGVFGVAAAMWRRPEFAWAAGGLVPEVAWLLGADGVRAFDELAPTPPAKLASQVFPDGGYAVLRAGWGATDHQMIVDVGPLGCPLSSGHGHADLLGVQCWAFGDPYLVDPGTYCYTADLAWRDYFRSARAHSVIVIDGQNHAVPAGPFRWQSRPGATLRAWQSKEDVDFVDGDHSAYGGLPDPVVHRRRVIFLKSDYWIIIDDLRGTSSHTVETRFQFGPRPVFVRPDRWACAPGVRGQGLWLYTFSLVRLSTLVHFGECDPIEGWVSSNYGRRTPAPVVISRAVARLPLRLITLVIPTKDVSAGPPLIRAIKDGNTTLRGCELADRGHLIEVAAHCVVVRRPGRIPLALSAPRPLSND